MSPPRSAIMGVMAGIDEIRREFEEHERICSAEQARLYRQLTDAERLAGYVEWLESYFRAFPPLDPAARARLRVVTDRDKDEAALRMAKALG